MFVARISRTIVDGSPTISFDGALYAMFIKLGTPQVITFGLAVLAMILTSIFFITGADSASVVMGSMSSRGTLQPSKPVVVFWGVAWTAAGTAHGNARTISETIWADRASWTTPNCVGCALRCGGGHSPLSTYALPDKDLEEALRHRARKQCSVAAHRALTAGLWAPIPFLPPCRNRA